MTGRDLRARLDRDAATLGAATTPGPVVTDEQVAALPPTVQRYLRFMGVVGRPSVRSFRARLHGSFRLRQGQAFMPAEVWQFNTVAPIARLFWMRISMAGGLLPMLGRDSYVHGRGRMLGKLLDAIVVADGRGEPFDIGELTTWLNDAVLLAPSMLLTAGAEFREIDDRSFGVSVTDSGRIVSARVVVDDDGAPVDFHTEDRFADLPGGPVRTPWSTPIDGWRVADGRRIPTRGSAVWHLPDGDLTYGILEFDDVEDNPAPPPRPSTPARSESVRSVLEAAGGAVGVALMLVGSPLLRGRYNRWGASDQECDAEMPGDELVPDPVLSSTRAVTIGAPPEAVWPWLAQIGQGRGGLYSYDALENLLGLDIHSADEILPEHQGIAPGELIRLGKKGSPCFRAVAVDRGRSLVLISADPATEQAVATPVREGTGATWQWELHAIDGGHATRLISRQLNTHPPSQCLLWRAVAPIGFVMERRMLLGIKERAESSAAY
ncbi:DUF6544 family protein [Tessaracoccus sp. G1721]